MYNYVAWPLLLVSFVVAAYGLLMEEWEYRQFLKNKS